MAQSNKFSIYLLKSEFDASNSLKDSSKLKQASATNLPKNATLFLLDNDPSEPWWKEYWGIQEDIEQVTKGAIIFLPVAKRVFAITYGHAYHGLKDASYEHDFGLRTTLNSLDPDKVKSTDTLYPESAKRERIQSPTSASWNFFDFKKDESIVRKLSGAVKTEYEDLFKNAGGTASFQCSSKYTPDKVAKLCARLLSIYKKDDFKITFPDLQGIIPLNDPILINRLNEELIKSFKGKEINLVLTIPEIIDYGEILYFTYGGAYSDGKQHDSVYIDNYREYLKNRDFNVNSISIEDLKRHVLKAHFDAKIRKEYSIFDSLIFDCKISGVHYHLREGMWYEIDTKYLNKIRKFLDEYFTTDSRLLPCSEKREDDYNQFLAKNNGWICLDKKNISLSKQTQVEPCDLLYQENDKTYFLHIKISTRSASLSHLFNQGLNSIELIRAEDESKQKLKNLIDNKEMGDIIDSNKYHIIYGVITAKPSNDKSDNLPIFSRISLSRAIKRCKTLGIGCSIVLIEDKVERK